MCRDRVGAYAEAARLGAPDAVQVADRRHLWHNLAQAVEQTVIGHRAALPGADDPTDTNADRADAGAPAEQPATVADSVPLDSGLAVRTRERHAAIDLLPQQGTSLTGIGQQLGLSRKTIRRFARSDNVEELLVKASAGDSLLDPFKPYLHERFNTGHTDATALTQEILAVGYRGSARTVRRCLQTFRTTGTAPPPKPLPPSIRQVTGWLTRRPSSLSEEEYLELKAILDRFAALATTHQQVRDFACMLTERRGGEVVEWINRVEAGGTQPLRAFATGLWSDLAAVTAGLCLDYSSGPVEGQVNRIKMLKRQVFGRAKFDLLPKRILNPA